MISWDSAFIAFNGSVKYQEKFEEYVKMLNEKVQQVQPLIDWYNQIVFEGLIEKKEVDVGLS